MYKKIYRTPTGFSDILLSSDGNSLTGLWFEGSRDAAKHTLDCEEKDLSVFRETAQWLDIYFSGKQPDFMPDIKISDMTAFRQEVTDCMMNIPYGETVTYGDIAKEIAAKHGMDRMSSQAVGGAVGWNPICIIIPCHRVVGAGHSLTGYGGGIENKISLLRLEGHDMSAYAK